MNNNHQNHRNLIRTDPNAESQISMVQRLLLSGLPHSMILMLIIAAVFPPQMLTALKR